MNRPPLNKYFDHTCLHQDATEKDIITLCNKAIEYDFFAVMVNPNYVTLAAEILDGHDIKIGTVCSFPLGASTTDSKISEALEAVKNGADEIDVVANIGWICDNQFEKVENELKEISESLPVHIILKVIIEAQNLNENSLSKTVKAVVNSGAQFVKTSSGFFGTARLDQIDIIKKLINNKICLKAAGGIKTYNDCLKFIEAGADRIGSSSSVAIMDEEKLEAKM